MSENMRMWIEVSFNVIYLLVVWSLVIRMKKKLGCLDDATKPLAKRFYLAFGLLALGDTGHVGFRVLGYLQGNLESSLQILGSTVTLVGLGALATAITVTFFYVLMLDSWHIRFQKPYGWVGYLLLAVAVIRLIIMAFPQNQWNQIVPPMGWSIYRNIPLMIQGLGVAILILLNSLHKKDHIFLKISIMIFISYICYMPVIFWVQKYPMIGMLMIPKTLAYLAIAFLAYRGIFNCKNS